ncbi:hypothetical protein TSAR_007872 [Trichomalopsis sarcophagae]|uniref:Uncharacterized protein n=1 Tax=Trichomalopsis sarcophagae TaxID=543379 RepID=A0A232EQG1_9HYME|nr:hypothetical protein TSAR_007872 [Trichomalopsis sarcophagae]
MFIKLAAATERRDEAEQHRRRRTKKNEEEERKEEEVEAAERWYVASEHQPRGIEWLIQRSPALGGQEQENKTINRNTNLTPSLG